MGVRRFVLSRARFRCATANASRRLSAGANCLLLRGLISGDTDDLVINRGSFHRRLNVDLVEWASPEFTVTQATPGSARRRLDRRFCGWRSKMARFMLQLSTSKLRFMESMRGVRADDG